MSLFFTEFSGLGRLNVFGDVDAPKGAMQAAQNPLVSNSITLSGSNQQSAAFNASTRLVRVVATVAAYVAFGSNPDATASPRVYMAAGSTDYFAVEPGQKIAGVTA